MYLSQAVVIAEIILIVGYLCVLSWYAEPIILEKNSDYYFMRKYILKVLIPCLAWMLMPFILVYLGDKLKISSAESILNSFESSVVMITAVVLFVIYECIRWPNNKLHLWKWLVKVVLVLLNIVYVQAEIRNGIFEFDNYKLVIAAGNFILCYMICISREYRGRIEKSSQYQQSAVIDIPRKSYEELFSIRKNEVKNLHDKIYSQNDSEPFAVMVKGKWGSGKTSLMNGFKDEYSSEYDFIDVKVGYTCDIGSLLGNIDKSFQNIFEEQLFFYKDSNKSIWNYFKLLKELTNGISEKSLDKIIETISKRESFTEAKNSINTLLDEYGRLTGKKIIIVIDDLERCPSQNLKNVFAVLIESFKLNNCITVLLCDYEQLKNRVDGGKDYLDKYINRSITLQMVEQSEQVKKLLENIDIPRKTKFIEDLVEIDKELRNLEEKDILTNDLDSNQYKTFLKKEDYTRLYRLPRTMVRIINSIKEKLVLLRYNIFEEDIANLEDEWIKGVVFVSFIEQVMPEVHDEIVVEENITTFMARNDGEDIKTDHHYRYMVFKRLFRGIDEFIFASVIYNTKEYINFENDREETIKEWNDNSLRVEKLESYLQFVNSNSDLLKIIDFMDKVEYCQKQDFDIKVINILSNHFGNYFNIDDKAADLCRKTKKVFEIANNRWNNEVIDYTDAFEVRSVRGNLGASEEKINHIIIYKCENVMTKALQQIEKLKTCTTKAYSQIIPNDSDYESFHKIAKKIFPEISKEEAYEYDDLFTGYLRELDLYIDSIRTYLVNYENDNPSILQVDEYLYYKKQLEICIEIISIMKDEFAQSKFIHNPEEEIILGLFNGEKVAQSNQAALTIKIAKVIESLDEETLKKKWKYILGIVDIGLSELRQEISKKETLDDYYVDMLHSCRKIYDKYKTTINEEEFSEYYWMGVDLIKLDELSNKNEEKEM